MFYKPSPPKTDIINKTVNKNLLFSCKTTRNLKYIIKNLYKIKLFGGI